MADDVYVVWPADDRIFAGCSLECMWTVEQEQEEEQEMIDRQQPSVPLVASRPPAARIAKKSLKQAENGRET